MELDPPEHLPPRPLEAAPVELRLGLGAVAPVRRRIVHGLEVADRDVDPGVGVPAARFEEEDPGGRILAQAGRQHAAGRAGAHHDVVMLGHGPSLFAASRATEPGPFFATGAGSFDRAAHHADRPVRRHRPPGSVCRRSLVGEALRVARMYRSLPPGARWGGDGGGALRLLSAISAGPVPGRARGLRRDGDRRPESEESASSQSPARAREARRGREPTMNLIRAARRTRQVEAPIRDPPRGRGPEDRARGEAPARRGHRAPRPGRRARGGGGGRGRGRASRSTRSGSLRRARATPSAPTPRSTCRAGRRRASGWRGGCCRGRCSTRRWR